MHLRPYQSEIHDAAIDFLLNREGNGIICSPGGTGKTLTMNAIIRTLVTKWVGTRVMSLVHDATVIDQNMNSMMRYWPNAPMGCYSAGLKQRDTLEPIIYGGIQSVGKRFKEFGRINVLLVDECDVVSPKDNALYQKFMNGLREENPDLRVLGFTATPFRLGVGLITEMDMWQEIVIDFTRGDKFMWFVTNGFLAPLVNKKAAKEIDITQLSIRCGDFDEKEMQLAADTDELNKSVVEEMIRYGSDRKHWLLFAAGINHGHKLTKLLNSKGIPSLMLTGSDSREDREAGEADFRSGKYRCLVNVGLYGRGYDFPELDLIGIARATQSTAWWLQAIKRGTRVAKDKQNCVILDFAGNTRRLGPVNMPNIPAPRKKGQAEKGECPMKICPICFSYVMVQTRICPDCNTEFPPPKTIQKTATTDAIMALSQSEIVPVVEDFYIRSIRYKEHVSKAGNKTFKVSYGVGTQNFSEYKLFESENNFILRNLEIWWRHRGGLLPMPESVDEALERTGELKIPTVIRVDVSKKHPEVCGCDFNEDAKISDDFNEDIDIPF